MPARILVVEDLSALPGQGGLSGGYRGRLPGGPYGSWASTTHDAIFTDITLSGKETGLDLLAESPGRNACPVILITGFPSVESAAEAVRLGGYDYLCKPVERDVLLHLARGRYGITPWPGKRNAPAVTWPRSSGA